MITLAFGVLAAAALFGAVLAILYARGPDARPIGRVVPAVHAAIGVAGLALLVAALRAGPGAVAARMGIANFGIFAAFLIALAFLVGLVIASYVWRGRRPGGAWIGAHATLAVAGVTLLLVLVALS